MLMRWRSSLAMATSTAGAAAIVRRPLWTRLAPRSLSTSGVEEKEAITTDALRKQRVFTDAQRKRFFATAPKGTSEKEAREFALLPSATKAYHEKAGHFIVPLHLCCVSAPEDATGALRKDRYTRVYGRVEDSSEIDWPQDVVAEKLKIGWALSKLMKNEKHRQNYPQAVSELRAIGFPVDEAAKDWRMFVWHHQTLPALTTFYQLQGHTMVHQKFAVPRGDPLWPEITWGLPLGSRVTVIRTTESTLAPRQLADLERLGFSSSVSQTEWDTRIKPSFKMFANENGGHCRIPQKFVVPSQAPWPTEAWGLKLGRVVDKIRAKTGYAKQVVEDADLLKSLGFQANMSEYMWSERVLPSLEVFKKVYGHCDVAYKFVVPGEEPWPEEAWGDKLGFCVHNIRSRGDYAVQIAEVADRLDAIGFVWDSWDNRWKHVVLPTLETFFHQYGNTEIPLEFTVPSEEPWLKEAWGFRLGYAVRNMKNRGDYAKQRQRDQARLEAIGLDLTLWEPGSEMGW